MRYPKNNCQTAPFESIPIETYNETVISRKNESPILVHGTNHSIAMSTPLFKHIPPDISKLQKKKKLRKRISNLNKSHVINKENPEVNEKVMTKSTNVFDCNLVSTLKKCNIANSHQKQNYALRSSSSCSKNQISFSKKKEKKEKPNK